MSVTTPVQAALRSNHALALHDACRRGAGIALLPAWASQEQGIFAIYPGYRFVPTKVAAFVDYFAERLGRARASAI